MFLHSFQFVFLASTYSTNQFGVFLNRVKGDACCHATIYHNPTNVNKLPLIVTALKRLLK